MFSTLLIGPPGCGKSTVASTAPKPILFLDMDQKVAKMTNIADKIKSGEVVAWTPNEKLFTGTLSAFVSGGTNPQAKYTQQRSMGYIKLVQVIDELEKNDCTYGGVHFATIVLDSFTSVEEHLKRLLMSANGVVTISQPLWGTVLTNHENMLSALLHLKANLVVISHEQAIKDDITGAIAYVPLISGQMKEKIGKDFEEVYFMEKKVQGDKAVYEMLTVGSSVKACRTTRDLLPRVEPDFSKIYK